MTTTSNKLDTILDHAAEGQSVSKEEIVFLLELEEEKHINTLFQAARDLRTRYFGDKIFLYGFLYISTYCRNNCRFCFYRRSNSESLRYRKDDAEIIEASCRMAESGVHLIDLTMGEDPEFLCSGPRGFERLANIVRSVSSATGLPVMISPGVVPDEVLQTLATAGASWYACYQETHCRSLFNQLRIGQSYDERLNKKYLAHRLGLLTEEGLLCGIGESHLDVAESIEVIRQLDTDQTRVMNFVPQKGTPMESVAPSKPQREFVIMAILRLAFPDRLIPASLDVDGLDGLKQRLDAGANVITSLVPPGHGLAGVAQNSLDIEDSRRTCSGVHPILNACGLRPATASEYLRWVENRKETVSRESRQGRVAC